jgi:UDP-N-acetylmuramate: L-alanyl-gamma-D-glutamyl-meso-diaminopimelate ligase
MILSPAQIGKNDRPFSTAWRLPKDLHYHFMGIGGVAMGNVAADLFRAGFKVTGSDSGLYSPMKEFLSQSKIYIKIPYSPDNLKWVDLAVIGNAISRGNPELEEILRQRIPYCSLVELLRWGILQGRKNLVITGTHGKTTSTALVAHILQKCGLNPGYLIGGIPRDFPSGFSSANGEYFVIEGDEYDTAFFDKRAKFLQYLPFAVLINNIEYDHADIYHNLAEIQESFRKLLKLIPDNGYLIINGDDDAITPTLSNARCQIVTFGLGEVNKYRGKLEKGRITIFKEGILWGEGAFSLPGEFNLRNALGAVCLLDSIGLRKNDVLAGLSTFRGVKRRMELVGDHSGILVYDDFAHHPTAVKSAIQAIKGMYPGRRLWAIFQPRSNTSVTNIFQKEWVDAFAAADKVIIAELHRKDSIPVERKLSRETLKCELTNMGIETFLWPDADSIIENIVILLKKGDIILTMSNSDFGGLAEKLCQKLKS